MSAFTGRMENVPTLRLEVGQAIECDGRVYSLKSRAPKGERALILVDGDGMPLAMTDREFLERQALGRVKLLDEAERRAAEGVPEERPRTVLDSLPEGPGRDAERAWHVNACAYVREWEARGRPARNKRNLASIIADVAVRVGADPARRRGEKVEPGRFSCPSVRTLQRWLKAWLDHGREPGMMVRQICNRGGTASKLHPAVVDIVETCIDKYYLSDSRHPYTGVHMEVANHIAERNKLLAPAERLSVPSVRAVRMAIARLDGFTVDFYRKGKRAAFHEWRQVQSGPGTEKHNQVWEIDHTPLDMLVVDRETRLAIGRPTVTIAIDRHTRMVVGFHIGFDAPGLYPVLECLRMAFGHKKEVLDAYPDVEGQWPCWGTPLTVVVDNAAEFHSDSFQDICLQFGIEVKYSPILKPWYKAIIERFMRTMLSYFHRVPGSTFSNVGMRGKEPAPEQVAVATMDELRGHLLRYLVDYYARSRHRGTEMQPLQAWERSVQAHGMLPPPNPDKVRKALTFSDMRKPQRQGILFEGNWYRSSDVALCRSRERAAVAVRIRVDPLDITRIWFLDPLDNLYKEVPIQEDRARSAKGVTLQKHRLALAMQRHDAEAYGGQEGRLRAYCTLDKAYERVDPAERQNKRQHAAGYREKAARAGERALAKPEAENVGVAATLGDELHGDDSDLVTDPVDVAGPPAAGPRAAVRRTAAPKAEAAAPPVPRAATVDDFDPEAFRRTTGLAIHKGDAS